MDTRLRGYDGCVEDGSPLLVIVFADAFAAVTTVLALRPDAFALRMLFFTAFPAKNPRFSPDCAAPLN
jgi:hypothetical protein